MLYSSMRNNVDGLSVPRSILPLQSVDDLPNKAPKLDKHVSIEKGEKYLSKIQNFTTYAGDQPYKNADIAIETIDPEKLADKLFLIQTYAQQSRISNMVEFASWLRYLGVDLFGLEGEVNVEEENGDIAATIEPSFFEVDQEGNYKCICGTHRFVTAMLLGAKPKCVVIRNYDQVGATPYEPVHISALKIEEGIPPDDQKRSYLPGKTFIDSIDFSPGDTPETRTNPNIFERRLRTLELNITPELPEAKVKALKEAKSFLNKLFDSPDFLVGIVTGSENKSDYPEFCNFDDITDLGDKYLVSFTLSWDRNNPGVQDFRLLAEKPGVTPRYSTAFVLEPDDTDSLNIIKSTQDQPIKYSSPVVSKKLVMTNGPYYDVYQLTLEDGTKVSSIENKKSIRNPELLPKGFNISGEGSVFIIKIKDQPGKYLVCKEGYKPQIGGKLYAGPAKCFGFVPERIEDNLNIVLAPKHFRESLAINSDPQKNGDFSTVDILFLEIDSAPINTITNKNFVDETIEFETPFIADAKEIYHQLRYGQIVDNQSSAPLFIALARDSYLQLDEDLAQKLIPFTEVFDPVHQQPYLSLPGSINPIGRRIGGLGFSDVGKSWITGMTTIAKPSLLLNFTDRHLSTLSVSEVWEGIKSGKFDLETTANLSRLFINGNLVNFSPSP